MAFDGFCIAAICDELRNTIKDGRISKISQPEKDEVIFTIKCATGQKRLFISCSPSLPLVYLTERGKDNPLTPPSFLMVLRKHLQGGRIADIRQPGLERIINIYIEHLDEMGYLCNRILVVEMMGKYSNIILVDENQKILDAAKRIPLSVSSVREVLPGRDYFVPNTMDKINPFEVGFPEFINLIKSGNENELPVNQLAKKIYTTFTGFSPMIAKETIVSALGVSDNNSEECFELSEANVSKIYDSFETHLECVRNGDFKPVVIVEDKNYKDFFFTKYGHYEKELLKEYDSVSELLFDFYNEKNKSNNIKSKSIVLRKTIGNILDKDYKKLELQNKQLAETENKDKYKLYGELLSAYSYDLKGNEKSYEALNYYTNEKITIPMNPQKNVFENSQAYYRKYNKLKRTEKALIEQTEIVSKEIEYLEGIKTFVEIASSENELNQIKEELYERGFVKKNPGIKNKKGKVKIMHLKYGKYDFYVGKNNIQNEEVTFKIATGNDWWFHAKGVPGAHVVVKCDSENPASEWDMPSDVFEAAGAVAVKYSSYKDVAKAEVDYTRKKHIKKPAEGSVGNVIYHTYYSLVADSDVSRFELTTAGS